MNDSEPIVYGVSWAVIEVTDSQWNHVVDWDIYELAGVLSDGKLYYSLMQETGVHEDSTNDITKAKPWASISIKWDGCSHLYFKDEGYYHVCGYSDWSEWNELIKDLFTRSKNLMKARGANLLEDCFPDE